MGESEIRQHIKEYLTFNKFSNTLLAFEEEIKQHPIRPTKKQQKTDDEMDQLPRIYQVFQQDRPKSAREVLLDKQLKGVEKNYVVVLQTAKQLLAIALDATNKLKATQSGQLVQETIETYTKQLSQFHSVLMSDATLDEMQAQNWLQESTIKSTRKNISNAMKWKDHTSIIRELAQIRAAALAIQPRQRRKLIDQLIKADIMCRQSAAMVRSRNEGLRKSAVALVAIIASTSKGTQYLLKNQGDQLISGLTEILTQAESGSVIQRLSLSSLQKLSVWDDQVLSSLIDCGFIQWICVEIIQKGILDQEYVHEFCLDFGTGLLANLINSSYGMVYLECRQQETAQIMQTLLECLTQNNVGSSVIIHLLVVLTCLANERFFGVQLQETQFSDRIGEFVEFYSMHTVENEDPDNRRTILDMCAHLFHPREQSMGNLDTSEVMEFNVKKHQEEIKELEKRMDDENELIVFECFPDEID